MTIQELTKLIMSKAKLPLYNRDAEGYNYYFLKVYESLVTTWVYNFTVELEKDPNHPLHVDRAKGSKLESYSDSRFYKPYHIGFADILKKFKTIKINIHEQPEIMAGMEILFPGFESYLMLKGIVE